MTQRKYYDSDSAVRRLRGSEKRDLFKWSHKQHPVPKSFYAGDADFYLVSKHPPGTVAYLDYKGSGEGVTFAEAIQYNVWMAHAPVFIVEGHDPENGPFIIRRYLGADWRPDPPIVHYGEEVRCATWAEFVEWESWLRQEYTKRGGWNGCLKTYDDTHINN